MDGNTTHIFFIFNYFLNANGFFFKFKRNNCVPYKIFKVFFGPLVKAVGRLIALLRSNVSPLERGVS